MNYNGVLCLSVFAFDFVKVAVDKFTLRGCVGQLVAGNFTGNLQGHAAYFVAQILLCLPAALLNRELGGVFLFLGLLLGLVGGVLTRAGR